MADISLLRRALINYTALRGDTFAPPPVSFTIDTVAEDFSTSTLKMQIRQAGETIKQLTVGSGITVSGNALQYSISTAEMVTLFKPGEYDYDVEKTTAGIVSTIQYGTITIVNDTTRA